MKTEEKSEKKRGKGKHLQELAAPLEPLAPLSADDEGWMAVLQETIAGLRAGEAAAALSTLGRLFDPSASLSSAGRVFRCTTMSVSKQMYVQPSTRWKRTRETSGLISVGSFSTARGEGGPATFSASSSWILRRAAASSAF